MPLFQYVGYYDRMYGGLKAADGRDLFVKQWDTAELREDQVPNDGMWVPVEEKAPETPETPETPSDPAPEAPAAG